jgi:prophage regulatory protein
MSLVDTKPDFMTLKETCELSTYSPSSIFRKVADGSFPPPVKLGDKKAFWLREDVEKWLADKIRARHTPVINPIPC